MNPSVAATLAQIIPVLFLTLLFEIKVRETVAGRSRLAIALGFLGNLAVATTAVALEFSLLNIVQMNGVESGARFEWIASIALFIIVVARWVATTTLARIVANNGPTFKAALTNSLKQFDKTFQFSDIFIAFLVAPSQVFANLLVAMAEVLKALVTTVATISEAIGRFFHKRR